MKKHVTERLAERGKEKYSGLLLVDILHPDGKNFFRRYAVDIIGFIAISAAVCLIIWVTAKLI